MALREKKGQHKLKLKLNKSPKHNVQCKKMKNTRCMITYKECALRAYKGKQGND
jgi:hypothetical protein